MPRESRGARGSSRDRRRGRRPKEATPPASRSRSRGDDEPIDESTYTLQVLPGRHQEALATHNIVVDDGDEGKRAVPHVCSRAGEAYVIRVSNNSRRHVACSIAVDGENALLKDGSLIVAPGDARELPGFLVSKNFVGKEYIKEYRDFVFGKPTVVEAPARGQEPAEDELAYKTYGGITCDVFEAVLDEELDSDQELRGQTTFYRGAGLNGSFDKRRVPEGKKKHFLYSAVTEQGARSSISNSTRGRWWVRGQRKLRTLEVRYRESHSLMLLGVDAKALGIKHCKDEDLKKEEVKDELDSFKKEEIEDKKPDGPADPGLVEMCDLTEEGAEGGAGVWTVGRRPEQAPPVDVEGS